MVAEEAMKLLQAARDGDLTSLNSDKVTDSLQDEHGATCLHYAARGGCLPAVEYLVNTRSLNPNKRSTVGATPLHDAAATGSLDVLKWLLANSNTKVDDQDGIGATVTHLAARYGHAQTLEWLLDETDCDVYKKSASGALPLHFAAEGGHLECVKLLLAEAPRSSNMQMNNGSTPSYLACQVGHLPVAEFLALKNGTPKIHTYDGMLPLHAAAQTGQLHVVKWLIKDQGLNPNERDFDGATPLHYAASRGHTGVVEWLLKEGGARIILDNLGGSPLHSAAEFGQNKVVLCLLQNGCSPDITDNQGLTAEELAEKCGQTTTAAILRGELTSVPESSTSPVRDPLKLQQPPPPSSLVVSTPSASSQPSTTAPTSNPSSQGFSIRQQSVPGSEKQAFFGREADYYSRSQSIVSVASSASSFGYFSPNSGGKTEVVSVDVHESLLKNQQVYVYNSQETGEQEYCPGKPVSYSPTQARSQASSSGLGASVSSGQSSTSSTLSSTSPRSRNTSESDRKVTTITHTRQREPSSSVSDTQRAYKSGATQTGVKTQSVVSPKSEMDGSNSDGAKVNGEVPGSAGAAKSVISITNKNVTIISTGKSGNPASKVTTTPLRSNNSDLPVRGAVSQRKKDAEFISALSQQFQANGTAAMVRPASVPVPIASKGADSGSFVKGANSETKSSWQQQQQQQSSSQTTTSAAHKQQQMPSEAAPPPQPVMMNGHAEDSVTTNGHGSSGQSSPGFVPPPPPPPAPGPKATSNGFKADASYNSTRPKSISAHPPMGSGTSSPRGYPMSPNQQKHDLMAALHAVVTSGAPTASLKKSKGPSTGGFKELVVSSKKSSGTSTPTMDKPAETSAPPTDEFDPKNFLDKVQKTEASGNQMPDWKRHMLAQKMAEKARAEYIERKKVEDYEARFANIPAWKRALIEKKEGGGHPK